MNGLVFYRCPKCGEMVAMVKKAKCTPACCGEEMVEVKAGSVDAAVEKHVPALSVDGSHLHVKVGSVEHPMTEEHLIQWIYVHTEQGGQRKALKAGQAPHAVFHLADGDKALSVYAYCNLHGLWMSKI